MAQAAHFKNKRAAGTLLLSYAIGSHMLSRYKTIFSVEHMS